jgi:hypothetical protein
MSLTFVQYDHIHAGKCCPVQAERFSDNAFYPVSADSQATILF